MSLVLGRYPFLANADYSFRVVGYSMFPVQRTGDMVLVKRGTENIQVGDIICFERDSELIGHRVIEIQIYPNIMFKTKGDNNNHVDGWIEPNSVLGKEILSIPLGLLIARNTFFLMIGLIIVLILIRIFYSLPERNILVRDSQYLLVDLDILFLVIILAFSLDRLWSL